MASNKAYLLYNNNEQEKLLAIAYSHDEINEYNEYYTKGTWFEYDLIINESGTNKLVNEKLLRKRVKFSKKPKKRVEYKENKEQFNWIK